ncbi:MAG: tetratricopeptide repeat protein, partial [Chloroflexota bacterium]
MGGAAREIWLRRLDAEMENLRTAVSWSSLTDGRQETGLRLAVALEDFWYALGHASEGCQRIEDLLARIASPAARLRARALDVLGLLGLYQGDVAQARSHFEAAHALHMSVGDVHKAAWSLTHQGLAALDLSDVQRAKPLLEHALSVHEEYGDRHGIGWSLNFLAQIHQLLRNHVQAAALYERSLAEFQDIGYMFGVSDQFAHLASVAREQGDYARARQLLRESLHVLRSLIDMPCLAKCFEGLGMLAAAEGQPARAAWLFGAAYNLREVIGTPVEMVDRVALEHAVPETRAALGEDAFAAAWAAGQGLSLHEAMALALEADG